MPSINATSINRAINRSLSITSTKKDVASSTRSIESISSGSESDDYKLSSFNEISPFNDFINKKCLDVAPMHSQTSDTNSALLSSSKSDDDLLDNQFQYDHDKFVNILDLLSIKSDLLSIEMEKITPGGIIRVSVAYEGIVLSTLIFYIQVLVMFFSLILF